jgi:hypothetical protein
VIPVSILSKIATHEPKLTNDFVCHTGDSHSFQVQQRIRDCTEMKANLFIVFGLVKIRSKNLLGRFRWESGMRNTYIGQTADRHTYDARPPAI